MVFYMIYDDDYFKKEKNKKQNNTLWAHLQVALVQNLIISSLKNATVW